MYPRTMLSALILVACAAPATLAAQAPTRLMGAPYHNPSRAFIDMMIPHHEMAVMMSEHHGAMSKHEAVKAIARKMAAEQRQEIADLTATRKVLFGSDSARSPMMRAMMQMMGMERMHDTAATRTMMDSMRMRRDTAAQRGGQHAGHQGGAMPGMTGGAGMGAMMSGDHDRMFLEHMISHHRDGIDMSILAEDSRAAARVKQLARKIRDGQERDIAEMRRILGTLPGAPAAGHRN
jgi:uncharacterized protein (DUF305 family)